MYFFNWLIRGSVCVCVCLWSGTVSVCPECRCDCRGVALRAKNNVTFSGTHTLIYTMRVWSGMQRGRRRARAWRRGRGRGRVADERRRKRGKHRGNKWQKICYKVSHMTEPTRTHTNTNTMPQSHRHRHWQHLRSASCTRSQLHIVSWERCTVLLWLWFVLPTLPVSSHVRKNTRSWERQLPRQSEGGGERGRERPYDAVALLCHRRIRVKFIFVF